MKSEIFENKLYLFSQIIDDNRIKNYNERETTHYL